MNGDRAAVLAIGAAAAVVALTQLPARELHANVRETTESYLLPPPKQVARMSLGYRSALADMLWADVLVTHGLRLGERRRHDIAINYIDAINELDPTFRDPYKHVDSLVTLQTKAASIEQVYAARRILERGLRERPYDAELWLIAGSFIGLMMPSNYLVDRPQEEIAEWERAGAEYLARAAELAPKDPTIEWLAQAGARKLALQGQLDRALELYAGIAANTEDPILRERIENLLNDVATQKALNEDVVQRRARRKAFDQIRFQHYPGATNIGAMVLGYPIDNAACAGGAKSTHADSTKCVRTWEDWAAKEPFGGLSPEDLHFGRASD